MDFDPTKLIDMGAALMGFTAFLYLVFSIGRQLVSAVDRLTATINQLAALINDLALRVTRVEAEMEREHKQ